MKAIIHYIRQYFYELDYKVFTLTTLLAGILIFINYYFNLNNIIRNQPLFISKLFAWYFVYLFAFALPYLFYGIICNKNYLAEPKFIILLIIAPLIFSFKQSFTKTICLDENIAWNNYWNHILYWPVLLFIIASILLFIWTLFDREQPFYGIKSKGINLKPYFLMLFFMIPFITLASTQADFLTVYPKLKTIVSLYNESSLNWWHKLLFEISYGSDFITIELFFRGFLILAFIKWAGKDAILPMACFYCTIHFGKPLGECISSYFGGILLGIMVFHTRSIFGGLIVHLGIAWMMELGGYFGNLLSK